MGAPELIVPGTASGTAPVGGTGTPDTIPRWTGATTLGDSGFVDDGSTIAAASRMLAIGTSSTTGARAVIQNNSSGNTLAIISLSVTGSAFGQLIDAGTNASDYALNIRQRNTGNPLVYVRGDGNVGIGTASPSAKLEIPSTASLAGIRVQFAAAPKNNYYNAEVHYFRNLSDQNRVAIDTVNNYIDASLAAGWGVKLPATPGNADTQTLDCYQENPLATTAGNGWTPTLSAAATWGGTQPTVDYARYIRIGSMVFCEVRLSGAALTATYGTTTISQPPVTINATAVESAVAVSTAAGSGVGVCTSTSVFLPTLGATSAMRLSWFYFTTS